MELALVVFLGELTLVSLLLFVGYKVYQNRQRTHNPAVLKFLCAVVLIIIWGLALYRQPPQLWQRVAAAFSSQYGLLLYYIGLDQMLNSKRRRSVLRSKVFLVTTLIVIVLIILDFHLGNYKNAFVSSAPNAPTWISYTEAASGYFGLLYLEALIVWAYAKDMRRRTDLLYTFRRGFCMLGFAVNMLGLLLLEGSVLLSALGRDGYSIVTSLLYLWSLMLFAVLLAGGYVLPDRFFTTALDPLYKHLRLRQRHQQELLSYLHTRMIQIVPSVHLDCEQVEGLRVLIEISDAREVILSQKLRTQAITAEDEANYLQHLIHQQTVFDLPGEYAPAAVISRDIVKYNLAVAKHLKRLQSNVASQMVAV